MITTQDMARPATELPDEFRVKLIADPLFANLDLWAFLPIHGGGVSQHTYRMFSTNREYFVKEVTYNEKYTLQLLHRAGLKIATAVHSTRLLEQGVLVTDFIGGERPRTKRLQPSLVHNYAVMQNALNDRSLFDQNPTPSGCKYTDRDDGFYKSSLVENFRNGRGYLQVLSGKYLPPILDEYNKIADYIEDRLDDFASEFSAMPFAWLHNDFREDNILGDPQRLIDWGSSYGHGPFLTDLAPFLVDEPGTFELFVQGSDICRSVDSSAAKRWLMISLAARFVEFIKFRIDLNVGDVDARQACRSYLEYEYFPFRHLISYSL